MRMSDLVEFHDVDEVLQSLGNPGRFQVLLFILLSSVYLPLAFNDYVVIFYGLPPTSVACYGVDKFYNDTTTNSSIIMKPGLNISRWDLPDHDCYCPHGYTYDYPGGQWSIIGDVWNNKFCTLHVEHCTDSRGFSL